MFCSFPSFCCSVNFCIVWLQQKEILRHSMERIQEMQRKFFNQLNEIHVQFYCPLNESLNRVKAEKWMSHFQSQSEVPLSFFLSLLSVIKFKLTIFEFLECSPRHTRRIFDHFTCCMAFTNWKIFETK
jgi:hypothetical protein